MGIRSQTTFFNMALVLAGGVTVLFLQYVTQRLSGDTISASIAPQHRAGACNDQSSIGDPGKAQAHTFSDKSSITDPRKAKVYTFNGQSLQRLQDFCTWTPSYKCTTMKTEYGGMPVYISDYIPEDTASLPFNLFKTGSWEPDVMRIILRELKKYPNAGFLDIGSNIGPFSLHAAKLKRKVISVDAVVDNLLILCKSVENNVVADQVSIVFNPVSNEYNNVSMKKIPPYNTGSKVIEAKPVVSTDEPTCAKQDLLRTILLDDLLPIVSFKTAVLKIDVESFEYHVITGGKKFFEQLHVPSIIMEWQHVKKTHGQALVDVMENYKYVPYPIQTGAEHALDYADYWNWPHDVFWVKTE